MIDPRLLERLPLVADGGVAAELRRRHPHHAGPVETLNTLDPEAVQAVHADFAAAGALLHRTNTARAGALTLEALGLADRAEAINNTGAAAVRQAIGLDGVMMGALGPPPAPGPDGTPTPGQVARSVGEQVVYLSDTGVSFFLLEHVTRLVDALALTGIVSDTSDAPVLAALMPDGAGRTADGHGVGEAARRLVDAGAGAVGLSCGPGTAHLAPLVDALLGVGVPVCVLAAAHPDVAAPPGELPAPEAPALHPDAFAAALAGVAAQGAAIVGGCCGATPAHIAALQRRLHGDAAEGG